jgi:type IV secretion system protein VirB10
MSTADELKRLEGEPEIPSLTPRRPPSNHKPLIAASVLILSLVGVLGFAATRYFGKKDAPVETTGDVASATATRLKFQDPPAPTIAADAAAAKAAPVVNETRVPSIEADSAAQARAIPVRGTAGGRSAKKTVPVGDESPFGSEGAAAPPQYNAAEPPPTAGIAGEAQANMKRYQAQLGGMLGQLQSLTDKAAGGDKASAGAASALAAAMVLPGTAPQASPALFGSMERSATPTVVAGLLGNRSLTMPKGVLFTCSLKTRVISATSGFVACQVQRNVFSDDGKVVLVERGSHLDGEYRVVQVRPGVTRIPVLWTRLRTPNGVTVDLDSPGTGALGESGIGGYVDNRWPERIGAAMLVSLIDDAVKIAATDSNPTTGSSTVLLPSTTAAGSKLAEKVLEATINIPPLLYQNQGSIVGVYVARDVDFSKVYALEPR